MAVKNLSRREFVVRAAGVAALPAVVSACKPEAPAPAPAVNAKTRIVNVTNPNNPTGTLLSREAVAGLAGSLPAGVSGAHAHAAR